MSATLWCVVKKKKLPLLCFGLPCASVISALTSDGSLDNMCLLQNEPTVKLDGFKLLWSDIFRKNNYSDPFSDAMLRETVIIIIIIYVLIIQ